MCRETLLVQTLCGETSAKAPRTRVAQAHAQACLEKLPRSSLGALPGLPVLILYYWVLTPYYWVLILYYWVLTAYYWVLILYYWVLTLYCPAQGPAQGLAPAPCTTSAQGFCCNTCTRPAQGWGMFAQGFFFSLQYNTVVRLKGQPQERRIIIFN